MSKKKSDNNYIFSINRLNAWVTNNRADILKLLLLLLLYIHTYTNIVSKLIKNLIIYKYKYINGLH